jgi:hypothetical protein
MSEQITWTHVDKLVRKMHDDKGMLPVGATDAEVTHAFIKWLSGRFNSVENERDVCRLNLEQMRQRVIELESRKVGKTKQRLKDLENQFERILEKLDRHCL